MDAHLLWAVFLIICALVCLVRGGHIFLNIGTYRRESSFKWFVGGAIIIALAIFVLISRPEHKSQTPPAQPMHLRPEPAPLPEVNPSRKGTKMAEEAIEVHTGNVSWRHV